MVPAVSRSLIVSDTPSIVRLQGPTSWHYYSLGAFHFRTCRLTKESFIIRR